MAEGPGAAPHSCLQECLNADDSANWSLLCNGTSLRLLHDNPALVKPAYVQVALDQVFEGGLFDEFAVVWLLHPAIAADVDEAVTIQGHRLRFATVDLTASHAALRARLLELASQE